MTEIRVPTLGESVSEATIGKWFKKPGDVVKNDEPIVELETDKVTLEVNAPDAGVLGEIVAKEGETVGVNALLGQITAGAAGAADANAASAGKDTAAATPAKAEAPAKPATPEAVPAAGDAPIQQKPGAAAPAATTMPPAPSAAKMMAESGVSVDSGSGKRGQVLKEDVIAAIAKGSAAPAASPAPAPIARAPSAPDDASREERVKMTKLRQTIARRLKESQNTAAMLTTFNEVDMTEVMALRAKYKDAFEKKHGAKLGFMGFFVKACVQALKELPGVNAEIDGNEIVYKNYYHIGIAVGTDKGLVVPVVREADQLSIAGIEKTIADFGRRARDGQLKIEEMQGGTFTITNGGIYGSLMSTPILNAPQSGILGMHKIQERPMVVAGKIEIRPMMYLALSYDHRVVDGKEAVTFLVRVKESLEDPARLVMDL
jgi:2-oxoglutarate dehydrogenase E2 component (dihydrolipoamide succinyltransferase)